jgi:NTP pyrophosphatase (non-canonical NTP hydrolase)
VNRPIPPEVPQSNHALVDIVAERERQDIMFGAIRILHQSPTLRMAILMEEVGELARAVLERDPASMRTEAVQVAAVAVALIEHLDHDHHTCRKAAAPLISGSNGRGHK